MSFERALAFTLGWEGGLVNHPNDPGGVTRYGISKRAYPNEDIINLTLTRAGEIYHRDYWTDIADFLPEPLDMVVFDTAVNVGKRKALLWLRAAGWPSEHIPAVTQKYLETRQAHYDRLAKQPRFKVFLRGWTNRVNALKKAAV